MKQLWIFDKLIYLNNTFETKVFDNTITDYQVSQTIPIWNEYFRNYNRYFFKSRYVR